MSDKSDSSRAILILAALHVLEHEGARALTLDKVAQKAEVSKGGLTHHFKSKQDLLLGVIDHTIHTINTRLAVAYQNEPDDGTPGRFTRAYLRVNLDCIRSGEAESMRSLLEMLVAEPSLALLRRHELLKLHENLQSDGLAPLHALTLISASDGCWINVILGFCDAADPIIEQVHDYLFALSRQPLPLPESSK